MIGLCLKFFVAHAAELIDIHADLDWKINCHIPQKLTQGKFLTFLQGARNTCYGRPFDSSSINRLRSTPGPSFYYYSQVCIWFSDLPSTFAP